MVGVLSLLIIDESFKWYGLLLLIVFVFVDSEFIWVNMIEIVVLDLFNNSLVELVFSFWVKNWKLKWFSKKRLMGKCVFFEIYKDIGMDGMRGSIRDGIVIF